jgi:hypothetical protein
VAVVGRPPNRPWWPDNGPTEHSTGRQTGSRSKAKVVRPPAHCAVGHCNTGVRSYALSITLSHCWRLLKRKARPTSERILHVRQPHGSMYGSMLTSVREKGRRKARGASRKHETCVQRPPPPRNMRTRMRLELALRSCPRHGVVRGWRSSKPLLFSA